MQLVYDLSSNDYHSPEFKGKKYYSSSQLKDILDDPEIFYKKYITGEIPRTHSPVFDIGTYFHTMVLEPEKINIECAVYKGVRSGAKWEAFKEKNAGKAIITDTGTKNSELIKAMNCVNAIHKSPIAMAYIRLGQPEVSAFIELHIFEGKVYFFSSNKSGKNNAFYLTLNGWEPCYLSPKSETFKLGIKVRADSIDMNGVSISDLKSASGDVKDSFTIKGKNSELIYDLSAALYLDIFSAVTGRKYTDFIWLYASKDMGTSSPYRASKKNIQIGRSKWAKAVIDIAKYVTNKWKIEEELRDLEAKEFENEWLHKGILETGTDCPLSNLSDLKRMLSVEYKKPIIEEDLL